MEALRMLPLASLSGRTLTKYMDQGTDFCAFCTAHRMNILPVTYLNLMAYFTGYFLRGNTTRTFPTLATRLRWYVRTVLRAVWLEESDPEAYKDFLEGRRALSKLDQSEPKKARPLYQSILQMLALRVKVAISTRFQVFVMFTLAHGAIQRLGELANGVARRRNLRHYVTPQGPFFAFLYMAHNKPKCHKIGQAPYAMISRAGNPFAYHIISAYLQLIHLHSKGSVYLFPYINSNGDVNFHRAMSKTFAVGTFRQLLSSAGVPAPSEYSGHSARRGGFVDRLHVPIRYVLVQGHWSANSDTADKDYNSHSVAHRMRYF